MGAKTHAIASEFDVHQSTIVCAIEKADRNYESIPHSQRCKISKTDEQKLVSAAKPNYNKRRQLLQVLQNNVVPQISTCTIQRRLKKHNIMKHHTTERPVLDKDHKQLRLDWAKQYKHYTAQDWCCLVWSDEVAVAQTDGKSTTWVFCTPQEKWDQECIEGVVYGLRISVMFWGCFAGRQEGGFTALWPDPAKRTRKALRQKLYSMHTRNISLKCLISIWIESSCKIMPRCTLAMW